MKCIREPFKTVKALLGEQEVITGEEYRVISFAVLVDVKGQAAVYNTLTGELLLLDADEAELFKSEKITVSDKTAGFIKKWFFVPLHQNDMELRNELLDFAGSFANKKKNAAFVIYPTTDCNARCFYCFELGRNHMHMSDEIARDTVKYILDSGEKNVKLNWFGGEPLYNSRAIDIIVDGLRDAGVEFTSTMISNAYLFDDELVKKAVDSWKLEKVQVTLDGTENEYNRIKAYIYRDGKSPFNIVIDNIERLVKAGIFVNIRLNLSNENFDDLMLLADYLGERFGGCKELKVYSFRLIEYADRPESIRTDLERSELARKWIELEDKLLKLGFSGGKALPSKMKANCCMADSNTTVTILPDGHLGKCEHHIDDMFVGDIYNGITDCEVCKNFCERIDNAEICNGCKMYPICIRLKSCSSINTSRICDEAMRFREERKLSFGVARAVERYLFKK